MTISPISASGHVVPLGRLLSFASISSIKLVSESRFIGRHVLLRNPRGAFPAELFSPAVFLDDHQAGGLNSLVGRKSAGAPQAFAAAPNAHVRIA